MLSSTTGVDPWCDGMDDLNCVRLRDSADAPCESVGKNFSRSWFWLTILKYDRVNTQRLAHQKVYLFYVNYTLIKTQPCICSAFCNLYCTFHTSSIQSSDYFGGRYDAPIHFIRKEWNTEYKWNRISSRFSNQMFSLADIKMLRCISLNLSCLIF